MLLFHLFVAYYSFLVPVSSSVLLIFSAVFYLFYYPFGLWVQQQIGQVYLQLQRCSGGSSGCSGDSVGQ